MTREMLLSAMQEITRRENCFVNKPVATSLLFWPLYTYAGQVTLGELSQEIFVIFLIYAWLVYKVNSEK